MRLTVNELERAIVWADTERLEENLRKGTRFKRPDVRVPAGFYSKLTTVPDTPLDIWAHLQDLDCTNVLSDRTVKTGCVVVETPQGQNVILCSGAETGCQNIAAELRRMLRGTAQRHSTQGLYRALQEILVQYEIKDPDSVEVLSWARATSLGATAPDEATVPDE